MVTLNPTVTEAAADALSLLERARAGDADAFCELCRVHETALLRQAMALCGNPTLAEDLAQDTLVEAWKSLRRYNGQCRLFTWLCAILLNRYRNARRQKHPLAWTAAARPESDEGEGRADNWLADSQAAPDEAAAARDQAALVRRCVASLPRKHQQVIGLRFFADGSLEEIASAIGCSVGTVKSRLFHALDKLRAMKELKGPPVALKMSGKARDSFARETRETHER